MNQDALIEELKNFYLSKYQKPFPNLEKSLREALTGVRELERLKIMRDEFGLELDGKKILEIGSGLGQFNIVCQQKGIECYGIEPGQMELGISLRLIDEAGGKRNIAQSIGEKLPFRDATFDFVVSFQVLEHTQSPEDVLQEAARVLKTGGHLYFIIPNYNSFWEGHFGLIWLPRLPKSLAKIYVRCAGRDANYLDELQYTTPARVQKALRKEKLEISNLGIEMWEKRLENASFSEWGSTGTLMKLTKLLHKLKVVSLIKYLGRKFEFYYPIILVARKNDT